VSAASAAPTVTEHAPDPQAARLLLQAITSSPLADKVMSRAWNGDIMQIGLRSDHSTVRDQLRLCTDLAGEFSDGYGLDQILVTAMDIGDSPAPATPRPEVRWNAKDRSCAQEPA
jgi:hypothetical protein